MTPTPVGMRCPECMQERTRVVRNPGGAPASGFAGAPATYTLVGINAVAFLITLAAGGGGFTVPSGNSVIVDFGLFGPLVAEGEWYRMITSAFLHGSLMHIGFNMLLLFLLGRMIEPSLGTPRFLALYFASLLGGALGALILDPNALTVGASGAVYGLFAAGFLMARERGMDALASELGLLIAFNLFLSFVIPRVSIGGHLGGLIAGGVCALILIAGSRGKLGSNSRATELVAMIAVALFCAVGGIAVA